MHYSRAVFLEKKLHAHEVEPCDGRIDWWYLTFWRALHRDIAILHGHIMNMNMNYHNKASNSNDTAPSPGNSKALPLL